ncbi:unnamed protein product [Chilo suppressalis]|uniref:LEM domain-containing protein n=1 Tax=Chilo suppressalis TaxID=168631 RepID=A0ABN8B6C4_CHISP|nr:unnamed protein product [Chilo suppressalis]
MGTTYRELFKLYDLIQCGDTRYVKNYLENCQVNVNEILPCKGIGVLHLAVGIEPLEKSEVCTELILKNGGDPNLCNDDGVTPVHIAAIWGRVDNLKLLIGCGGDPSRHDLDGHSAFDYAAREQQWDVYDYLHNVVDQLDDSFGSQCAYTLDLDKVLVTTDHMVAQYEPIERNNLCDITVPRKSEMVREWCEKSSNVINKLYPTILGETYLIENESVPWKSSDFTKHSSCDLSKDNNNSDKTELNETNNSFKTCLTKNVPGDIEISGIKRLESTTHQADCSCGHNSISDGKKSRMSVYENFSLPGSPNSITHQNYNTKSSLKKCQKCSVSSLCSDMKHMLTFDNTLSLITDDSSNVDLDKALIVIQNKTNEFLYSNISSVTDINAINTRRSSASSGVSSNYSGGSIMLASMHEEYKYEDKEENVVLIEKRLMTSPVVLPIEEGADLSSPDQTIVSVASSLPTSMQYDDNTLRSELIKLGFRPGPIQQTTRTLYLKKLQALKRNPIVISSQGKRKKTGQTLLSVASSLPTSVQYDDNTLRSELIKLGYQPGPIQHTTRKLYMKKLQALKRNLNVISSQGKTYSLELEKSLRSDEWTKNLTPYVELENKIRADFANPNKKWREGSNKTSFTYLLLDPRVTENLPSKAATQSPNLSWVTFVNSIFYVGKGKRSRPYSHLYQALTLWKRDFTTSKDKKVQHILDIWSNKVGVICLHIFQNVIPAEAYTYEAAMIDVLGVANLKNLKVGNYYGVAESLPLKERRMLGLYLLYKAMQIFISEGERQLRPDDID